MTVAHTMDSEGLLPRRYQEEVFARAQAGNIIAALSTGSGKTLISLLLIRWISSLETSKEKVIIFLVPKVALVEQQGNFIAKNTPLRVIKLHGALEIDLADRVQWRQRFENFDVFVMTAQIFLNLLTHSIWSIDRVSLMIFDECHHARKNHPYNGIMREYFHAASTVCRPKIFGMTASPIWNPKDAIGSLTTLEANMDSKVVGVHTHLDELDKHSPKPVEIIKEYPFPLETYTEFPSPTLWSCLQIFQQQTWDELEIPWNTLEMRYYATLNNLGPYAASLFLHAELDQHILRVHDTYMEAVQALDYASEMGLPTQLKLKPPPVEFWQIQQIHLGFEEWFSSGTSSPNPAIFPIPSTWCTPKIKTLADLLIAYYTPGFQGIIFVEQRQTATCLATILPMLSGLTGLIRCGALMGQGVNSDGIGKPTPAGHRNTVESFRRGDINLLIATSVAEEGLDFPACDLVIRFDPLAHMVGYVQSRGRARNKASTFIVMIQQGDTAHLTRYQTLKTVEPEVNKVYQSRHASTDDPLDDDIEGDEVNPADLLERERYVVESSGAVLTYDNSISLLNRLCSLIPSDAFTPPHVPKYSGDYEATLTLPSSIPLPASDLTFTGPPRRSKKEARRAAAFKAVKRLHELDVFDDFLLPVSRSKGRETEDVDGRPILDVSKVPIMMDVFVKDPWTTGRPLWIHPVYLNNQVAAGLVTGTQLPPVDVFSGQSIYTGPGRPMVFDDEDEESYKRNLMLKFTELGIWLRITARPITLPLGLFLVPLTASYEADFDTMKLLIAGPRGYPDWSVVNGDDLDSLIIMNTNEYGRPLLLHRIRDDLTPMSVPPPGSREYGHSTYYDYFVQKWTRKTWVARVPIHGPLVEAHILPRSFDGMYPLIPETKKAASAMKSVPNGLVAPRDSCQWFAMSPNVRRAYEVLPALCRRITDIYRVRRARFELGLPPIRDNLLVEALTLPSADSGYSNQRMETLGDEVLKLCTSVHLYNKFPHRHEGQLSILRQSSVSNRFLLSRAKDIGLEAYVTSEHLSVHSWRYTESLDKSLDPSSERSALRLYPRRSLQDCMEAILGASFLTGGIPMVLHTGTSLGLSFGGPVPWPTRYSRNPATSPASRYFSDLEESLGYTFHRRDLLIEAVTHPSISLTSGGPSYQRLEFLGDALLDLVVLSYLYKKFPNATSHQLSLPRSKAVCAPALAYLAVRRLNLHQILLVNRLDLTEAIDAYVPLFQSTAGQEIVERGWKYDPPKALSDVFESVMGAVLVDSAYNYDKAAGVVEHVMEDVLLALSPSIAWDPVTTLRLWIAGVGCSKLTIEKKMRSHNGVESEGVAVLIHGTIIAGPIVATSRSISKFVASERALTMLRDSDDGHLLLQLCDCQESKTNASVGSISRAFCSEGAFGPGDIGDWEEELEVVAALELGPSDVDA